MNLPTGTVTFLFTDIEGSTKLWERRPNAMRIALGRHDALLRQAIENNDGVVFKTIGDGFCAAFAAAPNALSAALAAQRALIDAEAAPDALALHVRMALHTGTAEPRDNDYFGQPLNRVARLLAAGHGGQTLLSSVAHELTRDTLPTSAGLLSLGDHRLRDLGSPEHIFQLLHPDLPSEFPPLKSLDNPDLPNNLPQQVTSFIGREKEIEAVKLLFGKTRLLTLTGSGGCGKTRLGLQVASDVLDNHAEGAWLVELAPLTDPGLVPQAVASVFGVRFEVGRPLLHTLVEALKPRNLLLIMDNCEHLLDGCAQLADTLIRSCPGIRILASSREALGIAGELTYRVPSLSSPDPMQPATALSVVQYEAVQLFVDRALFRLPEFAVTNHNAPALASVCFRLDGIPLAIELAAARVRSLSVQEINARLNNSFLLLTGGSRTGLPRQQTLRALIDWSYYLLNDQEKALVSRLSVFAGGWTLEAAESVCTSSHAETGGNRDRLGSDLGSHTGEGEKQDKANRAGISTEDVLELLTTLVDKSLVVADAEQGQTRYRLLETVRQYARDRLAEAGEDERMRELHQSFFTALAEEAEPHLEGPDAPVWLDRLETEHDNLRMAMEWRNNEKALRLAGALLGLWWIRGYYAEGREWLRVVLAGAAAKPRTSMRARVLYSAGVLAYSQCDYAAARRLLEESLELWQELGDKRGVAWSLRSLGYVAHHQGEYEAATDLYEQSLFICREVGSKSGVAWSLNCLGEIAHHNGKFAAAHRLYAESLALRRELGERRGLADSLYNLGENAHDSGDYAEAHGAFQESLALHRELGDIQGTAYALLGLAMVSHDLGDYTAARSMFEECLTIMRRLGEKHGIACSLEAIAALAYVQEQLRRALYLWGAAEAFREQYGTELPPSGRYRYDRQVTEARAALSEAAFASDWAQGRAMTLEQAIKCAMDDAAVSDAEQPPMPMH